VIFEYGNPESYSSSELKVAKKIDDELVTLYTYTDTVVDNYAAVYMYDHASAKEKWKYDFGSVASTNAFVGKLYAKNTGSFTDMIFATIGDKLTLIESNTGKVIHEYALNGNVSDLYYSKDGIIYVLTDNGVELAIPVRGVRKDQFENEDYVGIYQTRQFLSKPKNIAYYNGSYVVVNENSNEAYIYSDVKNEDFVEIFRNEINSSNSNVIINNSGTFAIVDIYKELMVYDFENKTSFSLDKYYGVSSYEFVQEEYLAVRAYTEEYKNYIYIYDLKTGEKIYEVSCDGVNSYEIDIINNKIILPESRKMRFMSIGGETNEWIPKVKSQSSYREWEEGYIHEFSASDDGKVAAFVDYYGDIGNRLEIYDINNNITTTMDDPNNTLNIEEQEVISFTWVGDDKVVIALKDNVIMYFNTDTGECLNEMKCEIPNIISMFKLDNETHIGILCSDSKVYRFNLIEGQIDNSIDLKNENIKTTSSDRGSYDVIPDKNMLVINWSGNSKGYFIDLSTFKVRFEIDNYADYCPRKNIVAVNEYNVAGYYPLYTTEDLIKKAEKYLPAK